MAIVQEIVPWRQLSSRSEAGQLKDLVLTQVMKSRLVVKSGKRILLLQPDQIEWVQAERNHVRFHRGSESFLVRGTMIQVSQMLGPGYFLRVNRSALVNVNHVKMIRPSQNGEYEIVMQNDTRLQTSRGYRGCLPEMRRFLGGNPEP
jgi:two-component system, LytTR family, response regulator